MRESTGHYLLNVARTAIGAALTRNPKPLQDLLAKAPDDVPEASGVFVTLYLDDHLRGCIGSLALEMPLEQAVARYACGAAFEDPRFPPLKPDELPHIHLDISVLSPLERVTDPHNLELGRHGVLVRGMGPYRGRQGTYLPQVAEHLSGTIIDFVDHCCQHKAGLPAGAWRDPSQAELFAYTAEVLSEAEVRR